MSACVYRVYDEAGELLYVGASVNVSRRLTYHQRGAAVGNRWWGPAVKTITLEHFPSRAEALAAETQAIATERPRFNVKADGGKDREELRPRKYKTPPKPERPCEWCATPLPHNRHSRQRYCDDNCRRDASFHRIHGGCVTCGARLTRGSTGARQCHECRAAADEKAHRELAQHVADLWNSGMTTREVAAAMGWTEGSTSVRMTNFRHEGFYFEPRNEPARRYQAELREAAA